MCSFQTREALGCPFYFNFNFTLLPSSTTQSNFYVNSRQWQVLSSVYQNEKKQLVFAFSYNLSFSLNFGPSVIIFVIFLSLRCFFIVLLLFASLSASQRRPLQILHLRLTSYFKLYSLKKVFECESPHKVRASLEWPCKRNQTLIL